MTTTKRDRGEGSVYQRGPVWWIAYYDDTGQKVRESSRSHERRTAAALLRKRQGEVVSGRHTGTAARRVRFEAVVELIRQDYAMNKRRSAARMEHAVKHLSGAFAGVRASRITTDRLTAYAAERMQAGAANATVQYELAILRRGFRLALRANTLPLMPAFPTIHVSNARQGFFEPDQLAAVLKELPDYLQPLFRFAALTGWRASDEVRPMTWAQVDLGAGIVRLEPRTTKNDDGRTFPFAVLPDLETLLRSQRAYTDMVESALGRPVPLVFHRFGSPIRNYRHAWAAACARAGVAGRVPHDLRRTAVRALERAGVSRSVAMKLTGHKTEAVYRRYAIVSEADLREGVAKLAVQSSGTIRAQSPE